MRLSRGMLRNSWLSVSLIVCFASAIALLMYLDYFNLEKFSAFNNVGFLFEYTWKGRLFLLFFFCLFISESFLNFRLLRQKTEVQHANCFKILALVFALVPLVYIVGVNFLGLDQTVIKLGEWLRGAYWKANSTSYANTLGFDWPISVEYVVFSASFLATILFAFGKKGLRAFSITAAFITVITVVYMIDTLYPYGAFTPFQALVLPISACATAFLGRVGVHFVMISLPHQALMPTLAIELHGSVVLTNIAWPCAGVQSFFVYAVIILLLLMKSSMSNLRKSVYFVIGLIGTYFVDVFRVVSYFVILVNQGQAAALIFHNIYGELYFFTFFVLYLLLIFCIEKYKIIERTRTALRKNNPARAS